MLKDLTPPTDAPEAQTDRAAELQEKWQTERGQVWEIGRHRLMCGDSTSEKDVGILIGDGNAETLVFDPPWDNAPLADKLNHSLIFTDSSRVGETIERFGSPTWLFVWDCVTSWYTPNRPLKRGKLALWYGPLETYEFDGAHYGAVGNSREVSNTRGTYTYVPDHRGKHLSDVFVSQITKLHSAGEHSYSKPFEWVKMLIANCTDGEIYDPFLGSGTTMVAAEQLNRTCYGMEIDPGYCGVVLERMSDTGLEPTVIERGN